MGSSGAKPSPGLNWVFPEQRKRCDASGKHRETPPPPPPTTADQPLVLPQAPRDEGLAGAQTWCDLPVAPAVSTVLSWQARGWPLWAMF